LLSRDSRAADFRRHEVSAPAHQTSPTTQLATLIDTLRLSRSNLSSSNHHQSPFLISSQCLCQWHTTACPLKLWRPDTPPCGLVLSLQTPSSLLLLLRLPVRGRAFGRFSLCSLTLCQIIAPSRTSSRLLHRPSWSRLPLSSSPPLSRARSPVRSRAPSHRLSYLLTQ
jgi:hypothetical protein